MKHSLMTTTIVAAFVVLALSFSPAIARNGDPVAKNNHASPEYLQGVLLIKLKPGLPNIRGGVDFGIPSLDNVLHTIGATKRGAMFPLAPYPAVQTLGLGTPDYGFERSYIIRYSSVYDAKAAAEMIAATGTVVYSEPHYIFQSYYTPNDPKVGEQVWLDNVSAKQAWDITKGDSTVVIGICDSGVEWTHEDLKDNIYSRPGETGLDGLGKDKRSNGIDDDGNGYIDDWHGWDVVGNVSANQINVKQFAPDNDPAPLLNYGGNHGTMVSGCASGATDNGTGIAGMGFRCKLLPIKIASDTVNTRQMYGGYEGIRYGVDAGVNIINCSWGGNNENVMQALQDVVDYAYSKNVLVVAAAGNSATNNDIIPTYPANLKHVLSVGATDANDSVATFSQYGTIVDVWAPGVNISTTNYGNAYKAVGVNGTSFSSPITAGAAGLVKSVHPNWTPDQIAMQLRVTGDRVKLKYPENGPLAYRRLNAYRAVTINQSFTGGNTLPGIGLISYTINGKATDTISPTKAVVDVQLTLKNYLAPSNAMQVEADAGQILKLEQSSYTIPAMGTMAETTATIRVMMNLSVTQVSEGTSTFTLKISGGGYEDYISVSIPFSQLPGWHKRFTSPNDSLQLPFILNDICATSVDQAWAVRLAAIPPGVPVCVFSRTVDGGQSWLPYTRLGSPGDVAISVFGIDANTAWICARNYITDVPTIYRTTNGGAAWDSTSVGNITNTPESIHFFDANNGIFIGDTAPPTASFGIGVSQDGGVTWNPLSPPLPRADSTDAPSLAACTAVDDKIWFGTQKNYVYRSADRGKSWGVVRLQGADSANVISSVLDLTFINANDGMAVVGADGQLRNSGLPVAIPRNIILVSRDGGASWQPISVPSNGAEPTSVTSVPGTTRVWVSTSIGVFETSDFGATWKPIPSPLNTAFTRMDVAAKGNVVNGFAISSAYDLYNIREGSSGVDDNASNTGSRSGGTSLLVLHPNMPNPFSATTRISFDLLRASSSAQLTVTDLTGRTLLQRNLGALPTGTHAITLDAASLPVGSYYYTIQAGTLRASSLMTVVR